MKLSIITINLNNAEGLRKTIVSVVFQTFTDYEFIVIDGGSTDGSVDVIKQYADRITYWVSEPDRGIYHAMNKGIMQANGEYCQFLNSGDWIIEAHGLQHVFEQNPVEDIVYCNAQIGENIEAYDSRMTLLHFWKGLQLSHQASFVKKVLFSTYGLYNEEHKIVSDWEFFLRTMIIEQCSYRHIPFLLIYFDPDGISSDFADIDMRDKEGEKVIKDNMPMLYDVYLEFASLRKEANYLRNELNYYGASKIIRLIKKIQLSGFYKKIRNLSFISQ